MPELHWRGFGEFRERQSEGIVLTKQRGAATLAREFGISRDTLYQDLRVAPKA